MPLLGRVGNWYSFLFLLLSGWPGIGFTINFCGWPQLSELHAMRNREYMNWFSKMDSHGLGKQNAKSRPGWRNPMEPKVWAHVTRNYFVGPISRIHFDKTKEHLYRFSAQITVRRSENLVSSRLRHGKVSLFFLFGQFQDNLWPISSWLHEFVGRSAVTHENARPQPLCVVYSGTGKHTIAAPLPRHQK